MSGTGDLWVPPHTVNQIPIHFLDLSSICSIWGITYVRRWLSFLFDAQQRPRSFLERIEVCRKSPLGGKCLCCPSFQGATLFIVTLSDHTVPKGSEEGAGRQSGCSAHFRNTLPFWKEVELWSPACYLLSSACLAAYPSSILIGHPLLSQRCEAGGSKLHHLIAVCPWAGH